MPEINLPEIVAEVTVALRLYEEALFANDVPTLDASFWTSSLTLRYGVGENLYGHEAIAAFRSARKPGNLGRRSTKVVVTTFGRDFATANVEYLQGEPAHTGRMSHTWVRFPEGWRIVAAHVSFISQT
jgi:hypothetical protein